MYCPSCGSEIAVELKYCNRCGASLSLTPVSYPLAAVNPPKLIAPTIVMGATIVVGLGIIFGGAKELAQLNIHPAALAWMVIFGVATLFGCTALLLRFWIKMFAYSSGAHQPQQSFRPGEQLPVTQQHLPPPRFEPVPSVTEHTTRTLAPAYRQSPDPGSRKES
ncbi:MAG TPA: zinc ribbon domain-containing protein [Pyrinomonadaceae bacterium]|nr:zinc ribbon domain-containing protein [Pyrinomonadaceae bacterium]